MQRTDTILGLDAEALLWLTGTAVILTVLVVVLAAMLVRLPPSWLVRPVHHIEEWLETHVPTVHRFLQQRLSRRSWHGLALTVGLVLFAFFSYLFAEVTEGWTNQEALYRIDRAVHNFFAGALDPATVEALRVLTYFGDVVVAVGLTVVLAAFFAYRRAWYWLTALLLTIGGGQAVVWTLKWAFARQRPDAGLVEALGQSFPSGHTFTATALYGFIIVFAWRWTQRRSMHILTIVVCVTLAVGVGLSRILLSVHWTSDVIGGLTLGLAWLICSLVLARVLRISVASS